MYFDTFAKLVYLFKPIWEFENLKYKSLNKTVKGAMFHPITYLPFFLIESKRLVLYQHWIN